MAVKEKGGKGGGGEKAGRRTRESRRDTLFRHKRERRLAYKFRDSRGKEVAHLSFSFPRFLQLPTTSVPLTDLLPFDQIHLDELARDKSPPKPHQDPAHIVALKSCKTSNDELAFSPPLPPLLPSASTQQPERELPPIPKTACTYIRRLFYPLKDRKTFSPLGSVVHPLPLLSLRSSPSSHSALTLLLISPISSPRYFSNSLMHLGLLGLLLPLLSPSQARDFLSVVCVPSFLKPRPSLSSSQTTTHHVFLRSRPHSPLRLSRSHRTR